MFNEQIFIFCWKISLELSKGYKKVRSREIKIWSFETEIPTTAATYATAIITTFIVLTASYATSSNSIYSTYSRVYVCVLCFYFKHTINSFFG